MFDDRCTEEATFSIPMFAHAETRPPLDCQLLLKRSMGNAAFALELLDELENNSPKQVAAVEDHVNSNNCIAAADVAHSLKGAAGIIGAESLQEIAAEVETAGRADDLSRLVELVKELQKEIVRCVDFVPQLRSDLRNRIETE